MDFTYEMKIPEDRIAVLIGKKGEVKRVIEKQLGVKIKVDSKEGDVVIACDDSLNLKTAENVVKAIARGFNPEITFILFDEESVFETINITEFSGKSKKKLIRLRGRAIGIEGKARENIEGLTGTHIMVYGKTIGIIGDYVRVDLARKAIESLLVGSRHSTVYAWLEKQTKELRRAEMAGKF